MTRLAFDIETDGLRREGKDGRPKMTRVHCIVTQDLDTREVRRYWDAEIAATPDGSLLEAVDALAKAAVLVSHNGVGFDLPVIEDEYGVDLWWRGGRGIGIHDTLVLSHLIFPRIGDIDRRQPDFPRHLFGRHSLEAWGYRLGHHKGDFAKQDHAFDELTPEMVDYCANDVAITAELYSRLMAKDWPEASIRLEHRFAWQIARMMDNGFPFDLHAALDLEERVETELSAIDERLHEALGPVVTEMKTKTKVEPVNLASTLQVTTKLQELYGWVPQVFTANGRPKFDDVVVSGLPETVPVKDDLVRRASLLGARKRLLGDQKKGTPGLIQHAQEVAPGEHRVFHYCNHNGARTGRCTHAHPNVNFPRVTSPWGPEFRGMVKAPEGWVIVGCDMSGVDARMIAHYLAPLDDGEMVKMVLAGSLHDDNRRLMAEVVPDITRSTGKNVFYAVCYGAYPARVGITAGNVGPKKGGQLRRLIRERVRGLDELIRGVSATTETRGWLRGLDGRRLVPDAPFSALNTLAQGGAAVVMKEATALVMEKIEAKNIPAVLILHVHDEGQILTRPEFADEVGQMFVDSIKEAGEVWGVRCPLDGEYKVGRTWAETH